MFHVRGVQVGLPTLPEGEVCLLPYTALGEEGVCGNSVCACVISLGVATEAYLEICRCLLTFCRCLILWFICCYIDMNSEYIVQSLLFNHVLLINQ